MLLVVDDEPLIAELLKYALADAGFGVVTACDGIQAMAELNLGANRFKAVITDIRIGTTPDGWDVGRRSRELVPNMPVVYITADSEQAWHSQGVPGSVLVSKPFRMTQLMTVILTLLTKADACGADSGQAAA